MTLTPSTGVTTLFGFPVKLLVFMDGPEAEAVDATTALAIKETDDGKACAAVVDTRRFISIIDARMASTCPCCGQRKETP